MTRRLLPPIWALLALAAMLALHFAAPLAPGLAWPLNLLGLLPLAAGAGLNLYGSRLFSRVGTTIKPFQPAASLVTRGPYRFTRNPMYLGGLLLLLGAAMLLGSVGPFLVVPVFFLLLDRVFVRAEEGMLQGRFGEVYDDYRRRVPRWI